MKKIIFIALLFPFVLSAQEVTEPKTEITTPNQWVGDKNKEDLYKTLEGYRQRVLKGESMATLAKQYSEDPGSAKNGGLYANITRGMMVPEFENVAFSLKSGEVSKVFETVYGLHFIQVVSNNGTTVDARHILLQFK